MSSTSFKARYSRLPTSPVPSYRSSYDSSSSELHELRPTRRATVEDADSDSDDADLHTPLSPNHGEAENGRRRRVYEFSHDPRFDQPTPSPWARAALIVWVVFLFWLAIKLRQNVWVAGIAMMEW